MKTTAFIHRAIVAAICLLVSSAGHAQAESYDDWYGEGETLELEPFEVTAEPWEEWELEYEFVWEELLDEVMWETAFDESDWEDFLDVLDDLVDWNQVDCLNGKSKARMAAGAYNPQAVGNNAVVTNTSSLGVNSSMLSNSNGFGAVIYQNSVTGTITVAFRGTDGESVGDWAANAGQSFGITTGQYTMAMNLAVTIAAANPTADIQFVGHSLGGGLASAASLVTSRSGTTFNAAGLHSDTTYSYNGTTLNGSSTLIDAFYVGGEILSAAQDSSPLPNAAGFRHRLTPASGLDWYEAVDKHGIQAVIDSFPC